LTLIEDAYSQLKLQLLSGQWLPGTLLSENELSEKMRMSRTPIRSAIAQLEYEGYLQSLKNRGVLVREISYKEIADMLEVLVVIFQLSLRRIEQDHLSIQYERLQEELEQAIEAEKNSEYYDYVEHSLNFVESIIADSRNIASINMFKQFRHKLNYFSNINFLKTRNQPHYSFNQVNQRMLAELQEKNYQNCFLAFEKHNQQVIYNILRNGTF
jgi:DNA-binding GntR family transcriptional regulator